jgi:hypothetical protein
MYILILEIASSSIIIKASKDIDKLIEAANIDKQTNSYRDSEYNIHLYRDSIGTKETIGDEINVFARYVIEPLEVI